MKQDAGYIQVAFVKMAVCISASRVAPLRPRRMIGGTLAPPVPWQAMVYLGDNVLTGGYAGGALISDRWVLTAGRNLFVSKSRQDTKGKGPLVPKVYLGISDLTKESKEVAVEKVSKQIKIVKRKFSSLLSKLKKRDASLYLTFVPSRSSSIRISRISPTGTTTWL